MEENKNSPFTIHHSQLKMIPELRFPEFKNDGEWVEKKLEEMADRYDNLRIPVTSSKRIKGTTPYYGANGIQDYVQGYTHDGEFILVAEDGANDLRNYPVQYVNGKIWVNNHAHVLQAKKGILTNIFLKYALKNINFEPYLVGGGRAKLNANIMMKIVFLSPSLPEQQKIAAFLSNLDELIAAHKQKLERLKQHKKGLMQNLFPSGNDELSMVNGELSMVNGELSMVNGELSMVNGELSMVNDELKNVPKLRFPEFKNSGEWVEKKLGEILKIGSGKGYKHLSPGNIPVYGTGGCMLYVNDFLYNGESVCIGRKGTIDRPMFLTGKFWTVDTLFYTYSFKKSIPKFMYFLFQRIEWKKYNEASGVPSLSRKTIEKIEIIIPNPPEQQKIAAFLSNLDELIEAVEKKIEQLEQHKKVLMQKMFPNYEL